VEQQRDVFVQSRLIAFDGEMVMRLTFEQVARQAALRQKGIGANRFAGDVDGVKHGGKHPDFIGLLALVLACYG
jgi:hypothetical protein